MKHHRRYKDTYLKYIQFRTLHNRFSTNEKLLKMHLLQTDLCGSCYKEIDSIEHSFLNCEISRELWSSVRDWIAELGMADYHLSN